MRKTLLLLLLAACSNLKSNMPMEDCLEGHAVLHQASTGKLLKVAYGGCAAEPKDYYREQITLVYMAEGYSDLARDKTAEGKAMLDKTVEFEAKFGTFPENTSELAQLDPPKVESRSKPPKKQKVKPKKKRK